MNVNDLYNAQFGGGNGILIDDNALHSGVFYAVTALTNDVTVDADACVTNIVDAADFPIPEGATIYGNFTSLKLTGGKVIAYYK